MAEIQFLDLIVNFESRMVRSTLSEGKESFMKADKQWLCFEMLFNARETGVASKAFHKMYRGSDGALREALSELRRRLRQFFVTIVSEHGFYRLARSHEFSEASGVI